MVRRGARLKMLPIMSTWAGLAAALRWEFLRRAEDSRGKTPAGRGIQGKIRYGGNTPIPPAWLRERLERVHVGGDIGDGGRQGRTASGQPQTLQNISCRVGRMYCRKNFHSAAAASFTLKNVQQEDSHHERSPGIIAVRRHVLCGHFRFDPIIDAWCGFPHRNRNGGR